MIRMNRWNLASWIGTALLLACGSMRANAADSLPQLRGGKAPTNLDELWGDYDPRKEPLETQVVREWQEGDVTIRHVLFTIGTFKGKTSRMAAFYGFVKSDKKVPGILQVHGGGQHASLDAVVENARNGYACLSINWGGNPMEGAKDGDPNTDWGAVDATQRHNDHYSGGKSDLKTLDSIDSPRNNNWFLLVLAARRGLTFLEQQPEVDPERLGVTGHSMGGKITVDVAGIDKRVKAAVPSCGGTGSLTGKLSGMPGAGLGAKTTDAEMQTIDDLPYIPRITCPILFMAPANDFAGPFDCMTVNWAKIGSRHVASTIAPHLNHRAIPETGICGVLWFDQYLKGAFAFPETPQLTVNLKTSSGVPRASVIIDRPTEVVKVDIYYSVDPHCLTRFWRDAEAKQEGQIWVADCPVLSTSQPLYVYANVSYRLKTAHYGFRGAKDPESFIISSKEAICLPEELQAAKVQATDAPSRTIDDFSRGWHDWYLLEWGNPQAWVAATRKVKDLKWRGPAGAKLVFEVKCPYDIVLRVSADLNGWGVYPGKPGGSYEARKPIKGAADWQTVSVAMEEMLSVKKTPAVPLDSWETVTELSFSWAPSYLKDGQEVSFGPENVQRRGWPGSREFRNLHWEGGVAGTEANAPTNLSDTAPTNLNETIQQAIKKSIDTEKSEQRP